MVGRKSSVEFTMTEGVQKGLGTVGVEDSLKRREETENFVKWGDESFKKISQ